MKAKPVAYWICTVLLAAMMLVSAFMYLTHNVGMMAKFKQLGYPDYFPTLLGVAKVLGVGILLAPGFKLLKEWAYAGFTITFVSAVISHVASNDAKSSVGALVALGLLAASYCLRPQDRRLVESPGTPVATV